MSFLDDIVDLGSSALSWVTGPSQGANLARTALAGYTLNQVNQSVNRENDTTSSAASTNRSATESTADQGVRVQVDPSPDQKIPVVYGRAALGGIITDAVMLNNNQTMFFCVTLCERTGRLNLGQGNLSQIKFGEIYRNNERLVFQQSGEGSGYVVAATIDEAGNYNYDLAGLIQVYCYSGSSDYPVLPAGYSNASTYAADVVFPNWDENFIMDGLVFAIVRIDYNKEKNLTGFGDWTFVLNNDMKNAGDVLFDYMTNTRYGAGIAVTEVNK